MLELGLGLRLELELGLGLMLELGLGLVLEPSSITSSAVSVPNESLYTIWAFQPTLLASYGWAYTAQLG